MAGKIDHPIKAVSNRTGLSQHIIRMWEKRYNAVTPLRTDTNRRLYSEEEIERLRLLKALTDNGHRISQIAQLPVEELQEIQELLNRDRSLLNIESNGWQYADLIQECLDCITQLDAHKLDLCLARAVISYPPLTLIEQFIYPLLTQMGDLWMKGHCRIVHTQFAVNLMRPFLLGAIKSYHIPSNAPLLVTATPLGQYHDFGTLFVMSAASYSGWRSVHFGAGLASQEIAAGVHQLGAKVLALSLVYPKGDPFLQQELFQLKQLLPKNTVLIVGGSAADSYSQILEQIGASRPASFTEFHCSLDALQTHPVLPEFKGIENITLHTKQKIKR